MPRKPLEPIFVSPDKPAPPVRRPPKRRRTRVSQWAWRIGIAGSLAAASLVTAANMSVPFRANLRAHGELQEMRQAVAQKEREQAALQQQLQLLKTDQGREIEARKQNLIRPGETPLHIEGETFPRGD